MWMYDNQKNGIFTCPSTLVIPSRDANGVPANWTIEYLPYKRRLNYIESTGTQYIDTGIAPNFANGDSVEAKVYKPEWNGVAPCIFGSRHFIDYSLVLSGFYILGNFHTSCDNSSFSSAKWSDFNEPGEYIIKVNDISIQINDTYYRMTKRVTSAYSMYIFGLNSNNTSGYLWNGMKLYDWKYYQNGVLVQHLIPVIDYNDMPCLYDKVTKTFFYNQGSGTFNYA